MKLKHADIRNFKGVSSAQIDFSANSSSDIRWRTALLGDNGSGKTTVLQAIALTLSLATRRTRFPDEFAWHGFLADRVSSLGPTSVTLDVVLDDEEINTTAELFQAWRDSRSADWPANHTIIPPSREKHVTLVYESGRVWSPQGPEAINQFLGRYYVKILSQTQPERKGDFAKLGDVFWFDQHRNLGSAAHADASSTPTGWEAGVEQLREFLVGWWAYHTSPAKGRGRDYIIDLQEHFNRVFPDTQFIGVRQREGVSASRVSDFYFLLQRNRRVFDLAEMSSGEQAVFPLIYEFARLDIRKSIVLIDELELHLHPPQQHALLSALKKLGPDCQYIITTHSPYLEEVIPDDQEKRLKGGQPCQ